VGLRLLGRFCSWSREGVRPEITRSLLSMTDGLTFKLGVSQLCGILQDNPVETTDRISVMLLCMVGRETTYV
jgi:hypothetical protein